MLKVFNTRAITRKQRFTNALVVSIPTAIVCTVVMLILGKMVGIISLLYLAIGYLLGYVVRRFGKGVQIHFSLLAAGLTIACILICDLLTYGQYVLYLYSGGLDALFQAGYRIGAIYLAYVNARII